MAIKQIKYTDPFVKYEQFSLHDSVIESMEIDNEQLILRFKEGFYLTNDDGFLEKQLNNCKIIYEFSFEENGEMYLSIVNYSNNKYKSVTFKSFLKFLKKAQFEVLFEFRSDFLKAVMLTGNIGRKYFEFKIHDIKKITYIYDEPKSI